MTSHAISMGWAPLPGSRFGNGWQSHWSRATAFTGCSRSDELREQRSRRCPGVGRCLRTGKLIDHAGCLGRNRRIPEEPPVPQHVPRVCVVPSARLTHFKPAAMGSRDLLPVGPHSCRPPEVRKFDAPTTLVRFPDGRLPRSRDERMTASAFCTNDSTSM